MDNLATFQLEEILNARTEGEFYIVDKATADRQPCPDFCFEDEYGSKQKFTWNVYDHPYRPASTYRKALLDALEYTE